MPINADYLCQAPPVKASVKSWFLMFYNHFLINSLIWVLSNQPPIDWKRS